MRASGLLLPVFSLPGKYGIGCFSDEAYRFVDFVKDAGQKYWQILPVGPTGYGDSPYQSFSAFAGNPYFISPDTLVREGLLMETEAAEAVYCAGTSGPVNYSWLYHTREPLLRKAYERWKGSGGPDAGSSAPAPAGFAAGISRAESAAGISCAESAVGICPAESAAGISCAESAAGICSEKSVKYAECSDSAKFASDISFADFCKENASWLPDYTLFMALKKAHGGTGFMQWEKALRLREPAALAQARQDLAEEIAFQSFLQYQFERQWTALKSYANGQGISIIGDIPIYVPADSAEVWACPKLFQLHEDGTCRAVAGCPPDGFSATGQLWGNPLYDWKHHRDTGYAWWISRMRRCSSLFDIVRIDHFRGFDQYYAIPADSADARIGQWEDGPGIGLFRAIEKEIPGLTIIAEDLGYITESVRQLVRDTGYPNMKVLEFAFDSRDSSGRESYLPYNYDKNCVVYTGTHDNETLVGWLDHILPKEREEVRAFTGLDGADKAGDAAETKRLARALIRTAMASVGNLCVIPMQDWLLLGDEARINTPSTTGRNWVWRMDQGAASPELAARIRKMTRTYGRQQGLTDNFLFKMEGPDKNGSASCGLGAYQ